MWKILVLDQQTKDILATVLRVQDLRDVGVTLHVWVDNRFYIGHLRIHLFARQLHSSRPIMPDVPAIYFVAPTMENIDRIAEDLRAGLYERFYLSFVEPISRALLEELATRVASDGTGDLVTKVSGV